MPRYAAFLRAINVGRRGASGTDLCAALVESGFERVESFLASGNVVFDALNADSRELEQRAEASLRSALGFEVETFVRSLEEVGRILADHPFRTLPLASPTSVQVVFLRSEPTPEQISQLKDFETPTDRLDVLGRELFWLCHTRISDSNVPWKSVARCLGGPTTTRNLNTLERLILKYAERPNADEARSQPGRRRKGK
ncbi:MAG: DUF1697 domain-containing protein [Isosphaeraceae bacterium]